MGNGGTFGFNGDQSRGFDLPAGVLDDFSVSVSRPGRARLRYNDVTKALELSVDGGGYAVVTTGGGSSPWVEVAGVIRPQNATDDVVIGAASLASSETLRVVGDARFEPDDTAGGFTVVDGGGNEVLSASQSGDVRVPNQLLLVERAGDPGATASTVKLYAKADPAGDSDLFAQIDTGTVSPLIPKFGSLSMINNLVKTSILAQNTPAKIAGSTSVNATRQFSMPANNRLQYDGTSTAWALILIQTSWASDVANKTQGPVVAVNGTPLASSANNEDASNVFRQATGAMAIFRLSPGDYVEAFVENLTDGTDVTVRNLQLIVITIG